MQVVIKPYNTTNNMQRSSKRKHYDFDSIENLDAKVILKVSMTEWKNLTYVSTNIFFVQYSFVSNLFL